MANLNTRPPVRSISKFGNSLGVVIPPDMLRKLRVRKGTRMLMSVADGRLVMEPVDPEPLRLADVLPRKPVTV
ncbi:MAG: AbrB/MazE/SpoVT family DNA-binding domain-containing protein [Rhodanobacteraceae bacterium]|nr:MAG: AbrB/MazE/SpoVT family DNA-binding domain-containing protein [Rhodanobacteraceae bacterium]